MEILAQMLSAFLGPRIQVKFSVISGDTVLVNASLDRVFRSARPPWATFVENNGDKRCLEPLDLCALPFEISVSVGD